MVRAPKLSTKAKVRGRIGYGGSKAKNTRLKVGNKPGGGGKGRQLGVKGSGHKKRNKNWKGD